MTIGIHLRKISLGLVVSLSGFATGRADEATVVPLEPRAAAVLRVYKSQRLHVRTDLEGRAADELFARLESTLRFAAQYWGQEPRGQIHCFVVDRLENWTDADLPHRMARIIVSRIGGATLPHMVTRGNRTYNEPTVYASSAPGVAEHEITHAYCTQTFGSTGPEWYKEGMAEMVVRRCTRESGLRCSTDQLATLRAGKDKRFEELFASGATGLQLHAALQAMLVDPNHRGKHVPDSAWTAQDSANVALARDEYLRSWAFCYMLLHNPNYAPRFRSLGQVFVSQQREAFDEFFSSVRGQMAFEYQFLLTHVDVGYRVDLCRWDWNTKSRPLESGQTHKATVLAARGYQASGLTVVAGQRYQYQADGRWSIDSTTDSVDANGQTSGAGRLVGVVLTDMSLGESFVLGARGNFEAPADGTLYLRCQDGWNELGDNQGRITIRFSRR